MGEKTRLTAMAAVFIALSVFCWGTSVWSAGQGTALAGQQSDWIQSDENSMDEGLSALPEYDTVSADAPAAVQQQTDSRQVLSEQQAVALAAAFSSAGTPIFEDPSTLTTVEQQEAVIWYLMETGGMPAAADGQVVLSGTEMSDLAGELFGTSISSPEDCALAAYDREQDVFILTAGVCIPDSAAVFESVQQQGNRTLYRMQLYPPDGWEGDVLGNEYRPDMAAAAVLILEDGRLAGWMGG